MSLSIFARRRATRKSGFHSPFEAVNGKQDALDRRIWHLAARSSRLLFIAAQTEATAPRIFGTLTDLVRLVREVVIQAILHSLSMAFMMLWDTLWALVLGFTISGVVQAVVSKGEISRLLPNDSPKTLGVACALGAASSSCSYAAAAITRSLVKKGANFTASMAFEFASTNLVIELGILLAVLIAWQFTLAEFVGGFLMIGILSVLFRLFLSKELEKEAREQAQKDVAGKMEGHAAMDMSIDPERGGIAKRLFSPEGLTATSHYFVMDVVGVWTDIALGLLIAGALGALVPSTFWRRFFLSGQSPAVQRVWGAAVGPLVSMASFVCSVGNVPLALVLWSGGISFGGVIAFIFADLLILPILNIYRKYYGGRMTLFLAVTSYVAMVAAALLVELIFSALHLIPAHREGEMLEMGLRWNYTAWLNIVSVVLVVLIVVRFLRTGGPEMLRMMDQPHAESHCCH
ncbi:MAG TPA: permease [Fimbriimonas sp.]|nr:permease [Fimbriimonas sp.]